jgi:hypothetical protein
MIGRRDIELVFTTGTHSMSIVAVKTSLFTPSSYSETLSIRYGRVIRRLSHVSHVNHINHSKLNLKPLIFVVHGGWADYSVDF